MHINKTQNLDVYKNISYDKLHRYILYYYQIFNIVKDRPANVLDIGSGNQTVADMLRKYGVNVVTCDIDNVNNPDKVGDVRNLPFADQSFETVVACEVLEHLPFDEFEKSIKELHRVARGKVIISIPFFGALVGASFKIKLSLLKKDFRFFLRMPYFWKKIGERDSKWHYWEMGAKGSSKKDLKKIISKYFDINNEFHTPLVEDRYFFILKKKNDRKTAKN